MHCNLQSVGRRGSRSGLSLQDPQCTTAASTSLTLPQLPLDSVITISYTVRILWRLVGICRYFLPHFHAHAQEPLFSNFRSNSRNVIAIRFIDRGLL